MRLTIVFAAAVAIFVGSVAERPLARVRIWDGSTPWIVTGRAEQWALPSASVTVPPGRVIGKHHSAV
jgi:hypothetical protein